MPSITRFYDSGKLVDIHGNEISDEIKLVDSMGNEMSRAEQTEIVRAVSELPVTKYIEEIKYALRHSPVVIIKWATGSGKSTQLPKQVLEEGIFACKNPSTVITQPRVSAATALASRVAKEAFAQTEDPQFALWDRVGYRTGRGVSSKYISQISFHTSMYEMMRLATGGGRPDLYMLDEIHTDDIGNLMLSRIVRDELEKRRSTMKVILASATMDEEKYLEYFSKVSKEIPVFDVEWRTFPIEEHHGRSGEFYEYFDRFQAERKNVLIFEPGKKEIEDTVVELQNRIGAGNTKIFAFHSDISIEDQQKIIQYQPTEGENVVIVATNAAEESLTVGYLDAVIDKGKFKVSSTGYDGVDRLDTKDASVANYRQRIWRTGRTHPGESARVNDTPLENLDAFKKPEITLQTLEREVLMFAKMGMNFLEEMSVAKGKWEKFLLDEADPKLIALTYERLYLHGAIDMQGNITLLGEECLRFPLSFFHAKILNEAVKRKVSKDMIDAVSILEVNGFLDGKGEWKNFYKQNRDKHYSDLEFQGKILSQFLSKNLDEQTLNFFGSECGFGFKWRELYKTGEKMFFEVVDPDDLKVFGINKRSLEKIAELRENLSRTLEENGLPIENGGTKDDKILSLLSGNLHNIFLYNHQDRAFEGALATRTKLSFVKSNTAVIEPDSRGKNTYYIGEPFIIGGDNERDDMNLLAFLTPVTDVHIGAFRTDLEKLMPKFSVLHNTPKAKALREYLAKLSHKDEYEMIDLREKRNQTVDDLVKSLEYTEDYAIIMNVLRDIQEKKLSRREIHDLFENIKGHRESLQKAFRQNSWIANFLESLDQLQKDDTFVLSWIEYGYRNPNQLFMNDPVFSDQGINTSILGQKNLYRAIMENVWKGELNEFFGKGEILDRIGLHKTRSGVDFVNMIDDIFVRLFHPDHRKKKNAERNLDSLIGKFENLSEYTKGLQEKHARNTRNISQIHKKIKQILADLRTFRKENRKFEDKIQEIDFDALLFELPTEKYGSVFTKKYFYSVSFGVVFEELFLGKKIEEEKIYTKIQEHFSSCLEPQEMEALAHIISSTASDIFEKNPIKKEGKQVLADIEEKIRTYFATSRAELDSIRESLEALEHHEYYQNMFNSVLNILIEHFDEKYVHMIHTKIFHFVSKIHESSFEKFDAKMKNFLESLDLSKLLSSGEQFAMIEDYNYNVDTLKTHFGKTIKELLYQESTPVDEVYYQTEKLSGMIHKTDRMKERLQEGDVSGVDFHNPSADR